MNANLQRRVQRYGWDKAADHYEGYWKAQLEPAQRRMLALANVQEGERVLDVACGTGLVTFPVAELVGAHGEVVGTDLSDRMVAAASARAVSLGHSNARFARRDAEDIGFDDECFDAVVCGLGLMYFPDPVHALSEMRRVVCEDGRVAVAVWGERKKCGWAEIFPIVDRRVQSDVCPLFFQLGTGDSLLRAMEAARFVDIDVERIETTLSYASAEDAIGAAFAGGPVALAYAKFDEQIRREAHAEYLESIERYRSGSGYAIPGEFVVACGHRF